MCDKSNDVKTDDEDLTELIRPLVEKQLKENNPEYDGSTLVLGGKPNAE